MNKILSPLFVAHRTLPASIPDDVRRDMVLTLLFWKMLSDAQQGKARYREAAYSGADPLIIQMRQNNCVTMPGACQYETCRWPKPFEAGAALRTSLYQWSNAQSNRSLDGVLRPERFGFLSAHHTVLSNSNPLADAANLIGGLSFADPVHDWTLGDLFTRAMQTLHNALTPIPANVVQLLVELLNPLPGDAIYDPACGTGQMLLACVDYVAANFPAHRLVLLGQESQSNQWALAKMQLLLSGLLLHRLALGDVLDKPMLFDERRFLLTANVVLTQLPEQAAPWDHHRARRENDPRFPKTPPEDSRLALIWTMLASMKPVVGRMGVLLPLAILTSEDGSVLRRYLLERNWLDAIITLPSQTRTLTGEPPVLLLARQQREHDSVAFISASALNAQLPSPYDFRTVRQAYAAYRERQSHACLRAITGNDIAARQYSFDLSAYSTAV